MLVLDTNVVSELMRIEPSAVVLAWLNEQPWHALFVTAFTKAEVLAGLARMPNGARRARLIREADTMFAEDFRGRILPFDSAAAAYFAEITATRGQRGRPIALFDAGIAAIARANGMAMVTRNVKDFHGIGLDIIDPWSA